VTLPIFPLRNKLHGLLKMFAGTLLRADCTMRLCFARPGPFCGPLQRVRERFFDINILASFASHDHGDGVPMVRSGDDYAWMSLLSRRARKSLKPLALPSLARERVQIGHEWIGDGDGIDLAGAEKSSDRIDPFAGADQTTPMRSLAPKTLRASGPAEATTLTRRLRALVEVPASYLKVGHFLPTSNSVL